MAVIVLLALAGIGALVRFDGRQAGRLRAWDESFYSPATAAEDLLSPDRVRMRTGILTYFYKAHALGADEVEAFVQFTCKIDNLSDVEEGTVLRIAQAGYVRLEPALVRAVNAAESAGQSCTPYGHDLVAKCLERIDARYSYAPATPATRVEHVNHVWRQRHPEAVPPLP